MMISSNINSASLYTDATATKRAPSSDASTPRTQASQSVSVSVSSAAESLARQSSAVDHAKVDGLRRRFSEGSYSVDHTKLAQTMLAQA